MKCPEIKLNLSLTDAKKIIDVSCKIKNKKRETANNYL